MSSERQGVLKFRDQDVTIIGDDVQVGDKVQDFVVMNKDWSWTHAIKDHQGKVLIIGSLPSLSTDVCDRETRRFNLAASALGEEVAVLMVSMDLPFTLNHWCAAADIERVITLSDHFRGEFGEKYGVLIKELRIFRRAVFVVDRHGRAVYTQYLPALGDEPDYNAVLEATKNALYSD